MVNFILNSTQFVPFSDHGINNDPFSYHLVEDFKSIQKVQNDLMRYLTGCQLKDKVSIRSLLDKLNMVSVNQLNAQIKLLEMWKTLHIEDYPLKLQQQEIREGMATTRAAIKGSAL